MSTAESGRATLIQGHCPLILSCLHTYVLFVLLLTHGEFSISIQFHMHNSTNTTVFLHILSNPILEASQGIQFGVYPVALCHMSPQSFSKVSCLSYGFSLLNHALFGVATLKYYGARL